MPPAETVLVYVRLLDAGPKAFRPTPATALGKDVARLAIPSDYDPDSERWEFEPGTVVALGRRLIDGEEVQVALRRTTRARAGE